MISIQKWLDTLMQLGMDMKHRPTLYGWKSPVNETNTMKRSTCVGYVSLALQRAGLLPSGKYVHLNNGKLAGTGLAYIKAHPEMFQIIWVRATPQKLGSALRIGDICLYTVPHIQVFAGTNKAGTPLWYSLERSSGGMGKPAMLTLASPFSYYTKRKIECIIRLKFDHSEEKPLPAIYKTKMNMNMRKEPNASSTVVTTIPKGAKVTVIRSLSGSTWKQVRYCEVTGYMNCSSTYATKIQ